MSWQTGWAHPATTIAGNEASAERAGLFAAGALLVYEFLDASGKFRIAYRESQIVSFRYGAQPPGYQLWLFSYPR